MTRGVRSIPEEPGAARLGAVRPEGMSHDDLVEALRAIRDLVDVGQDRPNFQFRSRPFLHFHVDAEGIYADVRFGRGDFEPVPASTPQERQELFARVCDHVERLDRARRPDHPRSRRNRRG
jgi:hypothetical protein